MAEVLNAMADTICKCLLETAKRVHVEQRAETHIALLRVMIANRERTSLILEKHHVIFVIPENTKN